MNEIVSIIVPIYNVENYIEECLNSIVNQTYKNLEILLVNDGSTDKTMEIVEKYKKDSRVRIIEQINQGQSVARNNALKIAKGDYILYVDSDDYLEKECIEVLINNAIKFDSEIVIFNHFEVYENNNKKIDVNIGIDKNKIYIGSEILKLLLEGKILGTLWNKFYKKSYLDSKKISLDSDRYYEDWYPIIKLCNEAKKISFSEKKLYYYRIREGSSLRKNKLEKLEKDYIYTAKKILVYLKEEGIKDEEILKFKAIIFSNSIERIKKINNISYKIYNLLDEDFNIKVKDILKLRKINKKILIKIFLWKLKLYHLQDKV